MKKLGRNSPSSAARLSAQTQTTKQLKSAWRRRLPRWKHRLRPSIKYYKDTEMLIDNIHCNFYIPIK
ncbi:hypothetical protein NOC27_1055 [Nitrosococcus oceani AFC27]|uniref:hypothetical protein n=1 Tax=Nitrosococcus oceani TaxID=1229 RepID=UPI000183C43D|nr:hypothetical protein [Nitrosococcus oceani]EDZ67728.1 hypothetical protein NOC27_1055 [Nitrosococcus oceani AFC27]